MDFNKELIKGSTETLILSLIKEEPMYGYQIIKELEKKSTGVFLLKEGTLYPILHGLEEKKVVESFWHKGDNGRKRKYYRLTKRGEEYFKEKQKEWDFFKNAVDNVLWEGFAWE
ncbi:PadR family transcriptional regulator [Clostridium tetani]|uniref:PadR family transcriptional regulator n=1 Tax=Clostridium tetani TaxID=1513 RepID=UPI00100AB14D|nr:PadR family transcriptional regulator [Clostridium tetani]RXI37964.1 PadR family transcriptional regulator [Clostridium tetani]